MKLIVWSGGQTGVDQTALRVAQEFGIETGGWVPRGWRTDMGSVPELGTVFGCREHESDQYPPRTQANVRDTQFTVWFGVPSPGFRCTRAACVKFERRFLVNPDTTTILEVLQGIKNFEKDHLGNEMAIRMNVAGNRWRTHPESSKLAQDALRAAFAAIHEHSWRIGRVGEFPQGMVGCACGVTRPWTPLEEV